MNALQELLEILRDPTEIKAARIVLGDCWIEIAVGYTPEDLSAFLSAVGLMHVTDTRGLVWLKDGSWLERDVFEGVHYWTRSRMPQIPLELT